MVGWQNQGLGECPVLTAGTHYTADTDFGALQFLDITGFTAPFKAAYSYGVATEIGIFTQALRAAPGPGAGCPAP